MGEPGIPPPGEYGDPCTLCFPVGGTPKFIYAAFSGLQVCNPGEYSEFWNYPTFEKLEQVHDDPCRWFWGDWDDWWIDYWGVDNGGSYFQMGYKTVTLFWDWRLGFGIMSFENQASCGGAQIGCESGSGGVAWGAGFEGNSIINLYDKIGVESVAENVFDIFPAPDDTQVIRIYNAALSMKSYMRYNPEEI